MNHPLSALVGIVAHRNYSSARDSLPVRMRGFVKVLAVSCVAAACSFPEPPPLVDGPPGAIDGPMIDADVGPDAEPACTPNTTVCDDPSERYVECSPTGTIVFEMECPLGCASDVEKCLDVKPTTDAGETDLSGHLDMAKDGPAVSLTGSSAVDTSSGTVLGGNEGGLSVPTMVVDGKRVFWMKSLVIDGSVDVDGTMPLVLLVDGDVQITGTLDISAEGTQAGPGAVTSALSCVPATVTVTSPTPGAGGAGRVSVGGSGGSSANGSGGSFGSTLNDSDIAPLRGGCQGGMAQTSTLVGAARSFGGGGGGAIQIVSRTMITVSGAIDASGGGGGAATSNTGVAAGGGGGGSGGAVLLEAPQVFVGGATAVVSTKGGGGGSMGGSGGVVGADGGTTSGAASGGNHPSGPDGGSGGTETSNPTPGQSGTDTNPGAGGGGSVGQTRVNTRVGLFSPQNGAAMRTALSSGTVSSRQVP